MCVLVLILVLVLVLVLILFKLLNAEATITPRLALATSTHLDYILWVCVWRERGAASHAGVRFS